MLYQLKLHVGNKTLDSILGTACYNFIKRDRLGCRRWLGIYLLANQKGKSKGQSHGIVNGSIDQQTECNRSRQKERDVKLIQESKTREESTTQCNAWQ